jgi:CheY-like chemotaxis protein
MRDRWGLVFSVFASFCPASGLAARAESPAHVPDWVTDAVFYQIFPERFANGDRSNDPTRDSLEDEVPVSWEVSPWTGDWYARAPWEKEIGVNFFEHGVFHRRSGGDLHVASKPRGGTAVTLCLPAAAFATPGTPGPAPPLSATREPGERSVLVVDDDEHVQFSSRKILQSLGYTVTEALDGPTALRLYQQAPRRFAVVLLDLRMPGMDGEEVLRRLLAIDPEVRVIICTGFERDQVSKRIFATGRVGFLGKPFGPKDVLEQIKFVHAELV